MQKVSSLKALYANLHFECNAVRASAAAMDDDVVMLRLARTKGHFGQKTNDRLT